MRTLTRNLVILPLTGLSVLLWVSMISAWVGHGKALAKTEGPDKALRQTIADLPEPPIPIRSKPMEQARKESAPAPAPRPLETVPPAGAAEAVPEDDSQTASLRAERGLLRQQGLDFIAKGKGLEDLPPIEGASDSLETYIAFSKLAGYRFAVYSAGQRRYLGELRLGGRPEIVPLDARSLGGRFSPKGRLIEHPALRAMAEEAARAHGEGQVRLYALCPTEWTAYLAGKILEAMRICGLERKDVSAFEVRFEVRHSKPTAVFTRALLTSGKEIAIQDSEG